MRLYSVRADESYAGGLAVVVADSPEAALAALGDRPYGPVLAPPDDLGVEVPGPARVLDEDFYQE